MAESKAKTDDSKAKLTSEETKKPKNLPANAMPTDGFVVSVDGKLKARYDNAEAALAAATTLKQRYPVIQTAVYDAAARTYTTVDPGAKDEKQPERKAEETPA